MQLTNRANLSRNVLAALQRRLPDFTTLQNFVVWGAHQAPPVRLLETVQQDEFTHDVLALIETEEGTRLCLVLDAT